MNLIPGWRQAWRLWSVRVSAIGAALFTFLIGAPDVALSIWNALPEDLQLLVPNARELALGLSIASIAARVIKQRAHDAEEQADG